MNYTVTRVQKPQVNDAARLATRLPTASPSGGNTLSDLQQVVGNRTVGRTLGSDASDVTLAEKALAAQAVQSTTGNSSTDRFLQAAATVTPTEPHIERTSEAVRQQDVTGGVRWHLEIEPGSGVVTKGTLLKIFLRNDRGIRGLFRSPPRVTVTTSGIPASSHWMEFPPPADLLRDWYGYRFLYKAMTAGPLEITVEAQPDYGPLVYPGEEPLRLFARLDVVTDPDASVSESQTRAQLDEDRLLKDPKTSPASFGQIFRRAATRRAIEHVNQNLAEVAELWKLFANPLTAAGALDEAANAVQADLQLELEQETREAQSKQASDTERLAEQRVPYSGTDLDLEAEAAEAALDAADLEDQVESIRAARGLLAEDSPVVGLLRLSRSDRQALGAPGNGSAIPLVLAALERLRQDCERTRAALLSGDLDVLRSPSLVDRMRSELGIEDDPARMGAIDAMINEEQSRKRSDMIGLLGANLLLLAIPGVGPYLAAVVSGSTAAVTWSDAFDLQAAAGAGIVAEGEATEATLEAIFETALAFMDVRAAVSGLKQPATRISKYRSASGSRSGSGRLARAKPRRRLPRAQSGALDYYFRSARGKERHEVLQNLWLEMNRFSTGRLEQYASRMNPVIHLGRKEHQMVSDFQRAYDLFDRATVGKMTYRQVVDRNIKILRAIGVDEGTLRYLRKDALNHAVTIVGRRNALRASRR